MYKLLIIIFLLSTQVSYAQYQTSDFESFDSLQGVWERETKKGKSQEIWEIVDKSTLKSKTINIIGMDTILSETVILQWKENEIFYTVTTIGQNSEKPIAFKLISNANHRFVFENKTHDFPSRIIYDLTEKNKLNATIEGEINGDERKINFNFLKLNR
jgi:hypothetical protein